jgi:hypothetical protein
MVGAQDRDQQQIKLKLMIRAGHGWTEFAGSWRVLIEGKAISARIKGGS